MLAASPSTQSAASAGGRRVNASSGIGLVIVRIVAAHRLPSGEPVHSVFTRTQERVMIGAMMSGPYLSTVADTIQSAIAPVFLLAGIGAILNVMVGRLARIVDRARKPRGNPPALDRARA
jgi:hypothetical protein